MRSRNLEITGWLVAIAIKISTQFLLLFHFWGRIENSFVRPALLNPRLSYKKVCTICILRQILLCWNLRFNDFWLSIPNALSDAKTWIKRRLCVFLSFSGMRSEWPSFPAWIDLYFWINGEHLTLTKWFLVYLLTWNMVQKWINFHAHALLGVICLIVVKSSCGLL